MKRVIPVNTPHIGHEELSNISKCINDGWISSGPMVEEFESCWARFCGSKHGVAVTNGTHALELAVWSLGLEPGSEVILPAFTIISCAIAVVRNGLKPVLVDVNRSDFNINVDLIEDKISRKTAAIMPVHMYGNPCDMQRILSIAKKYNLVVIEDAAEAHGAECMIDGVWRRSGGMGDVGCFSFYANKIITTGEGGMVVTNDDNLASTLRSKRNLHFGVGHDRFLHTGIGNNYRMTDMQASVGLAQFGKIDYLLGRKLRMAKYYNDNLAGVAGYGLPTVWGDRRNVYWMYGLVNELSHKNAKIIIGELAEYGIESRPFFTSLHRQPIGCDGSYPVADFASEHGFYIPSGPGLSDSDLKYIVDTLIRIAR